MRASNRGADSKGWSGKNLDCFVGFGYVLDDDIMWTKRRGGGCTAQPAIDPSSSLLWGMYHKCDGYLAAVLGTRLTWTTAAHNCS